jgi:hypothetical protein
VTANVGDLVTAENVSGLAIGTRVEWTSTHYGRVTASKIAVDAWVATRDGGGTVRFNDDEMAGGVPAYIAVTPEPVATIPAAELARLREIEEVSAGLLTRMADVEKYAALVAKYVGFCAEAGMRVELAKAHADVTLYRADLLRALTPPRTDPPAAWNGSIPHEPNEDK